MHVWVQQYGYAAVFVGTFVDGESVVLLAGFLAHGGYFNLTTVIIVSFVRSFCGCTTHASLPPLWSAL